MTDDEKLEYIRSYVPELQDLVKVLSKIAKSKKRLPPKVLNSVFDVCRSTDMLHRQLWEEYRDDLRPSRKENLE